MEPNQQIPLSPLELLKMHDKQIQFLKSSTEPKMKLSTFLDSTDGESQFRGSFNKYQQKQKQTELKETVSTGYSIRDSIKSKSCREKFMEIHEMKKQDFVFGKLLGKGKFGEVYLAKHKKSGFVCAMKILNKKKIIQQNILHQLIREIKIQLYCDHPNLVKLYSCFCSVDEVFLVTELCTQGQLYKMIQKYKQVSNNNEVVPQKTISQWLKQICEGIRYLHTLRIIHRDMKPENILMERGLVKICDFGWAVVQQNNLRSTFCGTPLYVSPEVLKGNKYDDKVDLWAIGIMAWQMKFGEIPFDINCQQQLIKIVTDDIVFPSGVKVSEQFKDFISKILQKNPKQRLKIGMLLQHTFLNV